MLQEVWTYLYKDVFKENDFYFTVGGSFLTTSTYFWLISGLYMIPDLTGWPKWMMKYKSQPTENKPLEPKLAWKAVKTAFSNTYFVALPYAVLLYPLQQYMGCSCRPEDLPTATRVLRDLVGAIIFQAILFYYGHWLSHWGPIYRNIHKKHHEWTAPIAMTCVYAHPLEHLVVNLMPVTLSGPLFSSHMFTSVFWILLGLTITAQDHSNYVLPYGANKGLHDLHHEKFNINYGNPLLDRLHGTDKMYDGSKLISSDSVLKQLAQKLTASRLHDD